MNLNKELRAIQAVEKMTAAFQSIYRERNYVIMGRHMIIKELTNEGIFYTVSPQNKPINGKRFSDLDDAMLYALQEFNKKRLPLKYMMSRFLAKVSTLIIGDQGTYVTTQMLEAALEKKITQKKKIQALYKK